MFALALLAELNGVTDLIPVDTAESPFYYKFRVQCTSCREVHPNAIEVSRFEVNSVSGSRGEANFVWRCKNCKRESTADIKEAPKPVTQGSPPKLQNIILFDCRGLEFIEFIPDGEFAAAGAETTTKFDEITLSEDWYDYDEKASEEVSIQNMKWEIKRA